jgi:dinuclear metal center YbgI/SA1388 family protein
MYKRVLQTLEKKFPPQLAESWDNVGLLVDSINPKSTDKVLLTIDLTTNVVNEAIKNDVGLIVAYHPFIFGGIKSLKLNNPQHVSLLKLIQNNVQVYCPHTAIDAAQGGVNDWLVKGVANGDGIESTQVIVPSKVDPNAGCGRVVQLRSSQSLLKWLPKFKTHLGVQHLMIATNDPESTFQSVAVCAGSGSGVFSSLKQDVDLYITGELSHHDVLMLKERGKTVICARHSASERGFLKELKQLIEQEVEVDVMISQEDCDPYDFI